MDSGLTDSKLSQNTTISRSSSVQGQNFSNLLHGQLAVDIEGFTLTEEDIEVLKHPRVSALILFSRNFKNIAQLKALTNSVHGVDSSLLILIDQEGGAVQRFVGEDFPALPSLKSIGLIQDPKQAQQYARTVGAQMAKSLLNVGVDLCLGPVLDCEPLTGTQTGDVLHERCFSHRSEQVMELAAAYIRGMSDAGMHAVGKHFPGHGGVAGDTHYTTQVDQRSLDELMQRDILPYVGLSHSLSGIMLSHVCFPKIDTLPCSLSSHWVQWIRDVLNFKGVIMTDCLSMAAISKIYPDPIDRIRLVFQSGGDLALLCNDRAGVKRVLSQLSRVRHQPLHKKLSILKSFA
tara:strand:- start:17 stop:1054 length:1038 start_codon:yes stop_codon:yes gene_type:complete